MSTSSPGSPTGRYQESENAQPELEPGLLSSPEIMEFSDWATNCPEYKVTAVQVALAKKMSTWQEHYHETRRLTTQIAGQIAK